MDQGEGVEGADRKEDPLDFALWKAQKAGEDTAWDAPWGRGPAGLAHRVLGDGRGAARRRLRDPRRRQRPRLPPPRERGGPDAHGAAAPSSRAIWMHNGMLQLGGEKMAKWSATSRCCPRRSSDWGRDALMLFFVAGHYRQPLRLATRRWPQARGRRRGASARPARRLVAGPVARGHGAAASERFFAALADDFNTPEALAAVWRLGRARPTARERRRATPTCARCSASSALDDLLDADADGGAGRRGARRCSSAAQAARAARDFAEADRLRDELAALRLGGPRLADGPRSCGRERARTAAPPTRAVDPLRPQPGPRGAAGRPPAGARGSGRRRRRRARAVAASGVAGRGRRRRRASSALRAATAHQGVCAEVGPYPYADAAELLRQPRPADRRARRGPGPAEPRRDLPHGRVRGRDRAS